MNMIESDDVPAILGLYVTEYVSNSRRYGSTIALFVLTVQSAAFITFSRS